VHRVGRAVLLAGEGESGERTWLSRRLRCCASDGSAAGTLGRNVSGRGAAPFEKLSTCLALIESVHSCNLSCPTCYADSPLGAGHNVDAVPLKDLQRRIQVSWIAKVELRSCNSPEASRHCIRSF